MGGETSYKSVPFMCTHTVICSEARRLLANADKFREIVLNFRNVESVGQGFAGEVFRGPELREENTNRVLEAMLRHVGHL